MPWRGPEEPGEFPTLGYLVADYIEAFCVIPDGDRAGDPFILTDEMVRFLLWFYRIDPATSRFVYYRGAQLVRPQKWGKGPFSAAIVCAEGDGPVLFDGWDAAGDPVGRPWATPWIQITAASAGQTDNVWRALLPMIKLGGLKAEIPDTGETRINLAGGGRIEPVTASARSRLGQRLTFAVQDETHSWWESNGGRRLADNQRRNLAGMDGRFMETSNAYDPLDESVAQQTAEGNEPGVYRDDVDPGPGSIRNKRERIRCMRKVYGDSMRAPSGARWVPWVAEERIDGEIEALLLRDPQQAERFFLNRKMATESAAFDHEKWKSLVDSDHQPAKGTLITVGIDGARFDDALAIVGTEVERAFQFVIGIWEVPEAEKNNDEYEHPFHEVDGALSEAVERYDLWRAYVDPGSQTGNISSLLDTWQGRWGDKRFIEWLMGRPRQVGMAVRNYNTAINSSDLRHDGHEVMARHIGNARRQRLSAFDEEHRQLWTIAKDRPGSPRKIDGAAAGVLSWEARGDCIAAGAQKQQTSRAVFL